MMLSEERRNEIAWKFLIYEVKRKGLPHLKPNEFQREVINVAKEIDISKEEAMEFAKDLIFPLIAEMTIPETDK